MDFKMSRNSVLNHCLSIPFIFMHPSPSMRLSSFTFDSSLLSSLASRAFCLLPLCPTSRGRRQSAAHHPPHVTRDTMSSKKDRDGGGGGSSAKKKGGGGRASSAAAAPAVSRSPSPPAVEPFVRAVSEYNTWKSTLPVLYDCFMHSNLEWPSYACAWGPVVPEAAGGGAAGTNNSAQPAAAAAAAANSPAAPPAQPHLTADALIPQTYTTSYVTQNFFFSRSTDSKLEKDKCQTSHLARDRCQTGRRDAVRVTAREIDPSSSSVFVVLCLLLLLGVGSPNMLLKGEIYYPNHYRVQDISKMRNFDEDQRNPALVIRKKVVHPGEINRIKVVPQFPDLLATHTDSPLVYVWNMNTQPARRSQLNTDPSVPDLTLQGHEEREDCNTLYYALDCSRHEPLVISGGSDRKICMWSIADYCSTLYTTRHAAAAASGARGAANMPSKRHIDRLLAPRMVFTGHTAQVEEVCFHPSSPDLLCSVGDDRLLLVWDVRTGGARPVLKVVTQHRDDVNAVHWNGVNENLLVTGSSDHTVKLIDLRRVTNSDSFQRSYTAQPSVVRAHQSSAGHSPAVIETFHGHRGNVTNVQWHTDGEHFASGSDDGDLCVWSVRGVEALKHAFPTAPSSGGGDRAASPSPSPSPSVSPSPSPPSGELPPASLWDGTDGQPAHLLFRHTGHRTAVVNFAWNPFVQDGKCGD